MRQVYRVGKPKRPVRKTSPCPYCKGKGLEYSKRAHPNNKDCADTGVETDWK